MTRTRLDLPWRYAGRSIQPVHQLSTGGLVDLPGKERAAGKDRIQVANGKYFWVTGPSGLGKAVEPAVTVHQVQICRRVEQRGLKERFVGSKGGAEPALRQVPRHDGIVEDAVYGATAEIPSCLTGEDANAIDIEP
jgi:hypothetical protein